MDDALRQRLVGAAVIIALAVIFVPMLLDSPEESQRTQQVDLTIPPRAEPGMETRRLPLDPAMTAPQPTPEPVADTTPADVAGPVPADGGIAAIDTPQAAAPPPTAAPPATPKPEPARTEPPKPAPAPAVAALPQPAQGGRFLAQFGSYAERANAEALVRDLAKAGVPATLETLPGTSGRPLHRVRSKPYATRAEADAARLGAQRQIAGLASSVVELAAADATQSAPARPNLSGWAVQVGVFTRREGAEELAQRLRDGGYAAFVEPVKLAGGQTSHRVRVGPETKRESAQRIQGELKSKFKLDALVVAHP